MSGIGIIWAIRKSAPRSRQITMPAPHHSVFTGRMPFLPPNQQRQSTEGIIHHNQQTVNRDDAAKFAILTEYYWGNDKNYNVASSKGLTLAAVRQDCRCARRASRSRDWHEIDQRMDERWSCRRRSCDVRAWAPASGEVLLSISVFTV